MLTRLNVVMILQYTHIKLLCCTPETNVYMSSIHQLKKRLKITELRIQLKKLEKGQQSKPNESTRGKNIIKTEAEINEIENCKTQSIKILYFEKFSKLVNYRLT